MAQSEGKKFEEDFIQSVPLNEFTMRLNDPGGGGKTTGKRFTPKNLCDFVLFAGDLLFLVELKSHKGKSVPKGEMKQLEGLLKIEHPRVVPCFVINFRDYSETYMITAKKVNEGMKDRKSITKEYCQKEGVFVSQRLKRTRWEYDIDFLFTYKKE